MSGEHPLHQRADTAKRYLARNDVLGKEDGENLATGALRLLVDLRFSELFTPGSRAEVPVVGSVEIGGETVSVSGVVDRLAEEGLARRRSAPDDRRAVLVELTPAGRRLAGRVMAARAAVIRAALRGLSGFPCSSS